MNFTIYIPEELGKRVREAKDELAVSQICQKALEQALRDLAQKQLPVGKAPVPPEMIRRSLKDLQAEIAEIAKSTRTIDRWWEQWMKEKGLWKEWMGEGFPKKGGRR